MKKKIQKKNLTFIHNKNSQKTKNRRDFPYLDKGHHFKGNIKENL